MLCPEKHASLVIVFDEGLGEPRDDGLAHAPQGVDASHHHGANTHVPDLRRPNGVKSVNERAFNGPTVNQTVHGDEQAETQHATEEDERSDTNADDVAHGKQRHGEVHTSIESGGNERNSAFDRVMRNLETFHHQAVESTDAKGIENRKRTISAFLTCDKNFSASHAFGVG